jgi:aquaporin Z
LTIEFMLTAIFVSMVLAVTRHAVPAAGAPLAIGGFYMVASLFAGPLGAGSLNPARSFATALFAGGDALSVLWIYVAGPIAGGIFGVLLYNVVIRNRDSVD